LRRELARLQEAVNSQHVHPRLGGKAPAQHRRGLRLPKLPASFVVPRGRLALGEGRVTFLRQVRRAGTVTLLNQSLRVGKKHKGRYLRLVIDTRRGKLKAYLNGAGGEALALPIVERLTDTKPRGRFRCPRPRSVPITCRLNALAD
jgi:hypothetical protein